MGMPYALMKRDKPEVFDLGKGSTLAGWPKVYGRRYGWPFDVKGVKGNFEEPLDPIPLTTLTRLIMEYDHGYTGHPDTVAKRIFDWVGDDVCFLINYWEEVEGLIEAGEMDAVASEFKDLAPVLCAPMKTYTQTGDVWGR